MKNSEKTDQIIPAFMKVLQTVENPHKNAVNPFHKNKYADINSVLEAVKPVLKDHGLALAQFPTYDFEGRPILETALLHESGQVISSSMLLCLPKDSPQDHGSAITYARRYALQSWFGLAAEDDDGNQASKVKPESKGRGGTFKTAADLLNTKNEDVKFNPPENGLMENLRFDLEQATDMAALEAAGKQVAENQSQLTEAQQEKLRFVYADSLQRIRRANA